MAITDVTVRGAGIFGLSIAWECARRGARVRVIDPHGPGAGASGGNVGALAPHVPENWNPKKQFQLESLLRAQGFWAEVAEAGGADPGYARLGRVQPLADEAAVALAQARAQGAAELWRGQADWRVDAENPAPGWAPESPSGHWLVDTLSARIAPRRGIAALVAALRAQGVTVEPEGPDEGAVVWATGAAGLATISAAMDQEVGRAIKGQSALLAHAPGPVAQLYLEGLHVVPHADGTVAIGSTTERDFADPAACDEGLEALIERARALVPALAEARVTERWAGLRPRARSRAPMLGAWPGRAGHFVANGGFKIGFGMGPGVARVMADLILEERDAIPEGFRLADNLR